MTTPSHQEPQALPEIWASGTPRELGLGHGRQATEMIHSVYAMRMARAAARSDESTVLKRAAQYLPIAAQLVPELVEEVEGLADGANLSFEQAFFLQVATEVELEATDGCSAVGSAVDGGRPFVAQNWDQPPDSAGKQLILHLVPDVGPALLMFTFAGVIGYIGMNSLGTGHVNNQLYGPSKPMGLTGYFITRKMLSLGRLSAALDWLRTVPVGSNGNYLFGDADGGLVDLELGNGRASEIWAPCQAHTNHYQSAGFRASDRVVEFLPDSVDRLAQLEETFVSTGTEAAAFASLRDHRGSPVSVCRHDSAEGLVTAASIFLRLDVGQMLVCIGPPCSGQYHAYNVGFMPSREQST